METNNKGFDMPEENKNISNTQIPKEHQKYTQLEDKKVEEAKSNKEGNTSEFESADSNQQSAGFGQEYKENNPQASNNNNNASKEYIKKSVPTLTLPNSGAVLTLGILSIVFSCCCFPIGLILAIIALSLFPAAKKLYLDNTTEYIQASYSNLNAGKVCSIVGLVFSLLVIIYYVVYMVSLGSGDFMFQIDEFLNSLDNI